MKRIRNVAFAGFAMMAVLSAFTAQSAEGLRTECKQAVADFLKADSTLEKFLKDSAGYAIFPSVGKGGLVIGGAHGKGLVYEKTNVIGQATMT